MSVTATVRARKGQGIVRLRAVMTADSAGNVPVTIFGSAFGRIVGVMYSPGTFATGANITISDADSGATLLSLAAAGTANRAFRPTAGITDQNGVAIAAATTATDTNRDIYVAGPLRVAVTAAGNATTGRIAVIVQEA